MFKRAARDRRWCVVFLPVRGASWGHGASCSHSIANVWLANTLTNYDRVSEQTMLSPQNMQALPGPHWVVKSSRGRAGRQCSCPTRRPSSSRACGRLQRQALHLHLPLRQLSRVSTEGAAALHTAGFSGPGRVMWTGCASTHVKCVCQEQPPRVCDKVRTAQQIVRKGWDARCMYIVIKQSQQHNYFTNGQYTLEGNIIVTRK